MIEGTRANTRGPDLELNRDLTQGLRPNRVLAPDPDHVPGPGDDKSPRALTDLEIHDGGTIPILPDANHAITDGDVIAVQVPLHRHPPGEGRLHHR